MEWRPAEACSRAVTSRRWDSAAAHTGWPPGVLAARFLAGFGLVLLRRRVGARQPGAEVRPPLVVATD
jgi:hypothetical protein